MPTLIVPRFLLLLTLATLLAAPLAAPGRAHAQGIVPGEVVLKYDGGTSRAQRIAVQAKTGTGDPQPVGGGTRVLRVKDGESVGETVRELRRRGVVQYAAPNVVARAAAFLPDDPGTGKAGDWQKQQWNFLLDSGVNAPDAWANARAAGAPGGKGVTVAVLDTGAAYANRGRFRRSPDFAGTSFATGYDFVADDAFPDDENGHGTFVTSILAEATDNGTGLTGLAYRARILPVRVLDARGEGEASVIERGIRYAVRRRAKVINLSLEFGTEVQAREIPGVIAALRAARRRGVVIVGAAGNEGAPAIAYPARASQVISVGATTTHRCLADYSNGGKGLDLVAPGGGPDADLPSDPACHPYQSSGRQITQISYKRGTFKRFGLRKEEGTSMAAPHVAAAAALVIASRVLGANPSPTAVQRRLESTAQDLGSRGTDSLYGAGLLDAAAATAPSGASGR